MLALENDEKPLIQNMVKFRVKKTELVVSEKKRIDIKM